MLYRETGLGSIEKTSETTNTHTPKRPKNTGYFHIRSILPTFSFLLYALSMPGSKICS